MFTIKSGDTYIVGAGYGDIQTSAKPKLFKTYKEANATAIHIRHKAEDLLQSYGKFADAEQVKVNKAKKDIARVSARLEELYKMPFAEVEKKVERARKQLKDAEWYTKGNSIASYRRSAARLEKLLARRMEVVELSELTA